MTELERSQAELNIAKAGMFNNLAWLFHSLKAMADMGTEAIRKEIDPASSSSRGASSPVPR